MAERGPTGRGHRSRGQRHRRPREVIVLAVRWYGRFRLSLRDACDLLAQRRIAASYETVRRWSKKFGQSFSDGVRRRRPRPGDKWHIDEEQLKVHGRKHWLWRALDQDGIVLDILVQQRRNKEAAETFLRRLVDGNGFEPRVVVTDKLASYPPAVRRVLPGVEHRGHNGLNNRAENCHRPTRRREGVLQRLKSPEHTQTRSRSFVRSAPSATTSAPVATSSRHGPTTTCCGSASPSGGQSRDWQRQSWRLAGAHTPPPINRLDLRS